MSSPDSNVVLVALGMVPSTGGTVQSVRNFSKALGAGVISFTDSVQLAAEGSALAQAVHVPIGQSLAGRHYSVPAKGDWASVNAVLTKAELLSCHVLFRYHTQWVARQAKARGIPYWVVPHGCLDPYVFSYRGFAKRLWMFLWGRRFLAGATHVIFSTERERIKAAPQYAGANTRVINWPVEAIDLHGAGTARRRGREQIKAKEGERVLLYLGRLHPMKQPRQVLQAWADASVANGHLVIAGPQEGVTHAELEQLAEAVGVRNVHLVGPVYGEQRLELLHASDGYISLSRRENFGYSAAEALSAGKPVILSPGNDLAFDLQPLACGWLLQDETTATAARAINAWAHAEPKVLQAMGERGRQYVLKELSFENFYTKLRNLSLEAVARNQRNP